MFIKAFFNSGLSTIFTLIFSFLTNLFFVRICGLELFGQYSYILSYVTVYFSLASLGVISSFTREATWYASHNKGISGFLTLVVLFILVSNITLALPAYYLYKYHLIEYIQIGDRTLYSIMALLVINILFLGPSTLMLGIFESNQRMKYPLFINIIISVFKLLVLIIFFLVSLNISSIISIIYLIPNILLFFLTYYFISREFDIKLTLNINIVDYEHFKSLIKYSLILFPVAFSELIISNFSSILLSKNESFENIGIFRVLFGIFVLINTFQSFLGKALLPIFSRFFYEDNLNSANLYFNFFFKVAIILTSPILIFIALFSKEIFHFYNINSSQATWYLYVFLITNYLMVGSFVGSFLNSFNRPKIVSISLLIGATANFLVLLFGVKFWGIAAAVISILICYLTMQVFLFYFLIKKLKTPVDLGLYFFNFLCSFVIFILLKSVYLCTNSISFTIVLLPLFILLYYRLLQKKYLFNQVEKNKILSIVSNIENVRFKFIIFQFLSLVGFN